MSYCFSAKTMRRDGLSPFISSCCSTGCFGLGWIPCSRAARTLQHELAAFVLLPSATFSCWRKIPARPKSARWKQRQKLRRDKLLRERWGVSTPPADTAESTQGSFRASPSEREEEQQLPSLGEVNHRCGTSLEKILYGLNPAIHFFFCMAFICSNITKECFKLNLSTTTAQQEFTQFSSCTLLQHLSGHKPTPLPRGLFGQMSPCLRTGFLITQDCISSGWWFSTSRS